MAFAFLRSQMEELMKQSSDSWRVLRCSRPIDLNLVLQYQQYPTAQLYIKALEYYAAGLTLLRDYSKGSVDNFADCDRLLPAFYKLVYGHIYENSLFPSYVVEQASYLVDQYITLKPDDFVAGYLKFIIMFKYFTLEKSKSTISDYERNKLLFRFGEKLARKLRSNKTPISDQQNVLADLYYYLGSRYASTTQPERALDSFEKCYELNEANYSALYGVAYHYMRTDPEGAKLLFHKYLEMAPKCDKKYPNAYYMLADIFTKEDNMDQAFKYCELAEMAEKERLPFLEPVSLPQKDRIQFLKRQSNKFTKQSRFSFRVWLGCVVIGSLGVFTYFVINIFLPFASTVPGRS